MLRPSSAPAAHAQPAPPRVAGAAWPRGNGLIALSFLCSLALHGLLLAIDFVMPDTQSPRERDPGLEVVLVNARHARAPEKADVLAQSNLDGGGNVEHDARPKSPLPPQTARQDGDALTDARKRTAARDSARPEVLTAAAAKAQTPAAVAEPEPAAAEPQPSGLDLLNSVAAVARLEAQIDKSLDEYSKRPRKEFIGAKAREYIFAQYIEDWRQKIERVGTLNYPDAARGKIYGSVLVFVSIRSDGSLLKAEIQRSSGEKVLDEAALRILHMAAPFSPFSDELKKKVDIIEFARTWIFTNENSLSAK